MRVQYVPSPCHIEHNLSGFDRFEYGDRFRMTQSLHLAMVNRNDLVACNKKNDLSFEWRKIETNDTNHKRILCIAYAILMRGTYSVHIEVCDLCLTVRVTISTL